MSWILLAAGGQFLNAVVAVVDKYLVTDERALPRPFVYAFYSCLVAGSWGLVFLLGYLPFLRDLGAPTFHNVQAPTLTVVGLAFLAAYTFFIALVSLYESLKQASASDVMPVIGSVAAISSFSLAHLFFDGRLAQHFILGIFLLAIGSFLVSRIHFTKDLILRTVHAGIFFALHNVTMKGLFIETSFDNGFFWSRVAFVVFALTLLLVPVYFEKIAGQTKKTSLSIGFLVIGSKITAGIAGFLLLKATDLGDVSIVQALDALKFVFILIIGFVISGFVPSAADEGRSNIHTILRRITYIAIITIGFMILFI